MCFSKGLERRCVESAPWLAPEGFDAFDSVIVEGDRHGPVEFASALPPVVVVPRKVLVRIQSAGGLASVRAQVFERSDTSFRRPRWEVPVRDDGIWLPAKPLVLALVSRGSAPDLHLLALRPGRTETLTYRKAEGWALLVRATTTRGSAVARARVVADFPPGSKSVHPPATAEAESDGLAVLGPIQGAFLTVRARAPSLLEAVDRGVGAPAGSFAFRSVVLPEGGRVEATVSIDGRPVANARCLLVSATASRKVEGALTLQPEMFSDTRTSQEGVCRTAPAREGPYLLRVIPDRGAGLDTAISIREGETVSADVALARIAVQGTVRRGEAPVSDAVVLAAPLGDFPSGGARTAFPEPMRAVTDADGRYAGEVWSTGTYSFEVMTSNGTGAADRDEYVGRDGATVDFELEVSGVRGVVVDQDGIAIEGARVTLMRIDGGTTDYRRAASDHEGRFSYDVEAGGDLQLLASKPGYKTSETMSVQFSPGSEVAPVTLVLRRLDSIRGRVVSSTGAALPGVAVSSYRAAGVPVGYGEAITDGTGEFTVARSPGGPTRLFVTGPACALGAHSFGSEDDEVVVTCSPDYAALHLTLADGEGKPMPDEWFYLSWNGVLVPRAVLMRCVASNAMPWTTDASGSLSIVGLSPGDFDVFLGTSASEYSIAEGQRYGYLGSTHADSGEATELNVRLGGGPNAAAPSVAVAR